MSYTRLHLIDPDGLCFTFAFDDDISDEKADQLHERFQELLPEAMEQLAQLCDMTVTSEILTKSGAEGYYELTTELARADNEKVAAERDRYRAENAKLIAEQDQRGEG